MKKILLILLLSFTPFLPQAQESFYTFDMTDFLAEMNKPWSIGNGTNQTTGEFEGEYFEAIVYDNMNLNGFTLEIMNSKVIVVGDTINSGEIKKRYFGISELEVQGQTLSVEDVSKPNIYLYPNPSSSKVTIEGEYIEKFSVYDISGRLMYSRKVRDVTHTMNVSNHSSGTYVLQIWLSGNRGVYKKLIINN